MKKNMIPADRIVRIAIAAILTFISLKAMVTGPAQVILLVAAGILLLTGLAGFCPLYSGFRFLTGKKKNL